MRARLIGVIFCGALAIVFPAALQAEGAPVPKADCGDDAASEAQITAIEADPGEPQTDRLRLLITFCKNGDGANFYGLDERLAVYLERYEGGKSSALVSPLVEMAQIQTNSKHWGSALVQLERAVGIIEANPDAEGMGFYLIRIRAELERLRVGTRHDTVLPKDTVAIRETQTANVERRVIAAMASRRLEIAEALKNTEANPEPVLNAAIEAVVKAKDADDVAGALTLAAQALKIVKQAEPTAAKQVDALRSTIQEIKRSLDDGRRTGDADRLYVQVKSLHRTASDERERLLIAAATIPLAQTPRELVRLSRQIAFEKLADEYEGTGRDPDERLPTIGGHQLKKADPAELGRQRVAKAVSARRRILALIEQDADSDPRERINALIMLANSLDAASAEPVRESEALLLKADDLNGRLAKSTAEQRAKTVDALADYYQRNEMPKEALVALRRQLAVVETDPAGDADSLERLKWDIARVATAGGNSALAAEVKAGISAAQKAKFEARLAELSAEIAEAEAQHGAQSVELAAALESLQALFMQGDRVEPWRNDALRLVWPLLERIPAIQAHIYGPDSAEFVTRTLALGDDYTNLGEYDKAVAVYRQSLSAAERGQPKDASSLADILSRLAQALVKANRHTEALQTDRRIVDLIEASPGPTNEALDSALDKVALQLDAMGREGEEVTVLTKLLTLIEAAKKQPVDEGKMTDYSAEDIIVRLGGLHTRLDNLPAAEESFEHALKLATERLGAGHRDLAPRLASLARVRRLMGKLDAARTLNEAIIALVERANKENQYHGGGGFLALESGAYESLTGQAMAELAAIAELQGRTDDAIELYAAAKMRLDNGGLGSGGTDFMNDVFMSRLLARTKHADQAEAVWSRVLGLVAKSPSEGADALVDVVSAETARIHLVKGDWRGASERFLRAIDRESQSIPAGVREMLKTASVLKNDPRLAPEGGAPLIGKAERLGYLQTSWRALGEKPLTEAAPQMAKLFKAAAGIATSQSSEALAQMAERSSIRDPELGKLVRERQDLASKLAGIETVQQSALKKSGSTERGTASRTEWTADIDRRIVEIDAAIDLRFPKYADLVRPRALELAETQSSLLDPNETLLVVIEAPPLGRLPAETYVLAVTAKEARFTKSKLSPADLREAVAVLRCGLDETGWSKKSDGACARRAGLDPGAGAPSPLPFDSAKAFQLFEGLFGEVGDLIKGHHLLYVPSGALARLPLQVLLTEPSPMSGLGNQPWLVRSADVTTLPAVSSLPALRRVATPSAATHRLIGFGNPLLDGNVADPDRERGKRYAALAEQARSITDCPAVAATQIADLRGMRGEEVPLSQQNGIVDQAHLRKQRPLPETIDELCGVARSLRADVKEIRLGARATEAEVNDLSQRGVLADYQIVHFATHGFLASQIKKSVEPGLILSPPETASEGDDGYLSASEIAALRLDADWVILSACNTAGPAAGLQQGADQEALSGLARAFFYAGARALLVSHWEVHTSATVNLITQAVGEFASDRETSAGQENRRSKTGIGRAEALQRAMLQMIDGGNPTEAQPAYWAPFVVVGEGGAGR